jgi:hypothetical protein
MKTYTMNYSTPTAVLKDFIWGTYRPTHGTGKPTVGDVILLTAKETDFAVGMVGVIKETDVDHERKTREGPVHLVVWKSGPKEIEGTFTCVQGGHISIQDRAHILAQLV